MSNEIMNAPKCAEYLGVPLTAIYLLCRKKEIPYRKVGKEYRFSTKAILNWLDTLEPKEI